MRVVISRVTSASVTVADEVIAELPRPGLLVLAGVGQADTAADAAALAAKIWQLRILADEKSASDIDAPILVVSQFTLYAATKKGRRPSWSAAAPVAISAPLVTELCTQLTSLGANVLTGEFGADMSVASVNDGPVTILIDTQDWR